MVKPYRYNQYEINYFLEKKYWKTTISDLWDKNASDYPNREAIEDQKEKLNWYQAKSWTDTFAINLLELGFIRDDIVVLQLPNCVELPLLRVACEKAGVLSAPVQPNLRSKEIQYILSYLKAKAIVIPRKFRNFDYVRMIEDIYTELTQLKYLFVIEEEEEDKKNLSVRKMSKERLGYKYSSNDLERQRYKPSEVSIINSTTGTTGFPKFAEYPAGANVAWAEGQAPYLELNKDDNVAAIAPASRGPCIPAYYDAPWVAAKTIMLPWKGRGIGAREALEFIESKEITVACGVPTILSMLLDQYKKGNYDLNSIRIWYNAGSLMPPSLIDAIETNMGGIVITNYGAVDFGGLFVMSIRDAIYERKFTVGKPSFGTQVKIVDENDNQITSSSSGEVLGRGPSCSSGYYNDPESTDNAWKDGWFHTGDLGKIDQAGNLIIVGRKKDMIIRGGQNIYPAELENILLSHPKVSEVAVIGISNSVMGEKVCACIVLETEKTFTFEEMVEFLKKEDLAPFKIPEYIEIMDKFPLISDQKVDKKRLKQDIEKKFNINS